MSSPPEPDGRAGRQLLRCPRCRSRLIYPRDVAGYDAAVVIERRCPECEHRDSVVVNALAADVWARHEQRLGAELATLADALASGQPIQLSDVLTP